MRFAFKGTLLVLLGYLAVCSVFLVWSRNLTASGSEEVMTATARAVAEEIAAVLRTEVADDLVAGDPQARRRVLNRLYDVVRDSVVVDSLSVVDTAGEVFASDEFTRVGERAPTPATLFAAGTAPRIVRTDHHGSGYEIDVPVLRSGQAVGYLQLHLRFRELSGLVRQSRGQLLLVSLLGFAALSIFALLVQSQLRRRLGQLQTALDDALAGRSAESPTPAPPPREGDEFGAALAAAGRLGRELQVERERTSVAGQRLLRFAHLVDTGVLLLRADGGLEFASERAAELFGLAADAAPETWTERLRPLLDHLGQLAATSGNGRATRTVDLTRDDTRLRCQAHPLEERGETGWLVLVRDRELVTALESDLRMAAQLRGLTRLYMGVAHDLKAPLNAMVLNLELLKRSIAKPWIEDEDARRDRELEWTGILESEIARLRRSLEALLAQTAPPRDDRGELDLREVLGEILALLAPQARQQRVKLDAALGDAAVRVEGSRDQIKQAILNIAINGLEATPEAGTLAIGLHSEGSEAVVRVQDTGAGIPPEALERVFEMHFSTKATGSGIGLHVARTIVESHAGTIRVAATGPSGTTFEIRLPQAADRT